jgi:outer membrane immunogenic protein
MNRKISTLALIAITAAGGAQAAGPEPVAAAPVVVTAASSPFWEGGYIGGQLGYAYGDFDAGNVFDGDDNDDGFIGGITAGYLWNVSPNWYVGPEFQYDWADLEIKDSDTGDTISTDEIARLKLIVGYEMGDGLLYGSGGIAYGNFDDAGDLFDGFDGSDTNWVLGFGYDYRIGENWSIGGEYQYHDFDDVNVNTIHLKAAYRF